MRQPAYLHRLAVALLILAAALAAACSPATPVPDALASTPLPTSASTTPAPLASPSTAALAPIPSDVELARRFDADKAMAGIRTLTSPEFSGRRAGTPGADAAAQWIAGQFRTLGLQPAGDAGTYLQDLTLPFLDLAEMPALTVLGKDGSATAFRPRQDFREIVSEAAGGGRAEGEVVYVGAGATRDYQGLDVAGKIVLTNSPQPVQAAYVAAGRGARAILALTSDPSRLTYRGSYIAPLRADAIPCLLVNEGVVNALLKDRGLSAADLASVAPGPLGIVARASVVLQPVEDRHSSNVLAVFPGTDPTLSGEVVIVGAHYDHLGTDPDGTLYPGANDDASGVAVLIEMARVLGEAGFRPGRTLLFAAWTAEEAGLLGAAHYVRNPRFPLASTVAMLQLDVVGQGAGATLNVTRGRGSLPGQVHAAAAELGVGTSAEPAEGGSDHVPFVQAGVPAVLLIWADVMPFIHTSRDTVDSLDAAKLRASGQVALLTVIRLASGR